MLKNTAFDMYFHWSKPVSFGLISVQNILRLSHFLLVDLYNEVWMEVCLLFYVFFSSQVGICCKTHNTDQTACACACALSLHWGFYSKPFSFHVNAFKGFGSYFFHEMQLIVVKYNVCRGKDGTFNIFATSWK